MAETPEFIGQKYTDTDTGNVWNAESLTLGDWSLQVQDTKLTWTPRSSNIAEEIGFFSFVDMPGITDIVFGATTSLQGFDIESTETPVTFQAPNLTTIPQGVLRFIANIGLETISCPALTSVGFPIEFSDNEALSDLDLSALVSSQSTSFGNNDLLTALDLSSLTTVTSQFACSGHAILASLSLAALATVSGAFSCSSNPSLTSLALTSLTSIGETLTCTNNAALTTISLPAYLPTNGQNQSFNGCALNVASVNHFLARCVANAGYVSGTINLAGGTNAAPAGQGSTDKTTLIGRGCTVTTN